MRFLDKIANSIVSRIVDNQTKKEINQNDFNRQLSTELTELKKMIVDLGSERKKEEVILNPDDELDVLLKRVEEIVEASEDSSVLILSRSGGAQTTIVLGSGNQVSSSIRFAADEDPSLLNLFSQVGHDLFMNRIIEQDETSYPSGESKKGDIAKKIEVPGIGDFLGIPINNIDEMSEDEIDKIVEGIIKKPSKDSDLDDKDESNEE